MIILIAGASHTGKTLLAQKILEKIFYPYISLDHLKMGLIRSGTIDLSPTDDNAIVCKLWPIAREMIKTAIENKQNLVIEGCYIPYDWEEGFTTSERCKIKYICLVMSQEYIESNFEDIIRYENVIEHRISGFTYTKEKLIEENSLNQVMCNKKNNQFILIDSKYNGDTFTNFLNNVSAWDIMEKDGGMYR